jgi:putative membrane protein
MTIPGGRPHVRRCMPARPETLSLHSANERTMLAWLRTGISLMGFGFAIARFGLYLHEQAMAEHIELGRTATRTVGSGWVGALLVGIGTITNFAATLRYRRVRDAIERGDVGAPNSLLAYGIGAMTTLIGLVMVVLLLRALNE